MNYDLRTATFETEFQKLLHLHSRASRILDSFDSCHESCKISSQIQGIQNYPRNQETSCLRFQTHSRHSTRKTSSSFCPVLELNSTTSKPETYTTGPLPDCHAKVDTYLTTPLMLDLEPLILAQTQNSSDWP